MLERVTRAPTLFFDANPLGRIINRFSKDTAATDSSLPNLAAMFINMLWYVLVMVGLSLSVFPQLIPLVIILLAINLVIRRLSLTATTDALRLDAITRSPVNSLFAATLGGLLTVRAFAQ